MAEGLMPTLRASSPMGLKTIGSDRTALGSADRSNVAALDQGDELVPLGMAQLDHVFGLTYPDGVSVDSNLRAVIAFRAEAEDHRFHAVLLPPREMGLEAA